MNKLLAVTALTLTLAASASAFADDGAACGSAAPNQWLSQDAITAKAVELGYQVRRVKIDDGCYEVYGIDKNGAKVELYMNPVTGAIANQKIDD
jgi:hypothetical protein